MVNVKFLFGNRANLPSSSSEGNLLFDNQGSIYRGMGEGQPLKKYSDVLSYGSFEELQSTNPSIPNKLYLINNSQLYAYYNNNYHLVVGANTVESFEAEKVTYNNESSTLTSENVNDAIDELDSKIISNTQSINTLQSNEGKVKASETDVLGTLDSKVDGTTIIIEDDKLKVVGVTGITVGTTSINQLAGVTSNVQQQLNDLTSLISSSSSGMNYFGKLSTKADLDTAPKVNGTLVVVESDEDNNNASTMYIYSESAEAYEYLGSFEFNESFLGLSDTPNAYEDGKILKSTESGLVFGTVDYSELTNKPQSTITQIDSAVANSHTHSNASVLNKLSEDGNGDLLYDGESIKFELQWEEFNS